MPPDPSPARVAACSRTVGDDECIIITHDLASDRMDVSVRVQTGDFFTGSLRLEASSVPFDRFAEFSRVALTHPSRERVEGVFSFALEPIPSSREECELVWRFSEERFDEAFARERRTRESAGDDFASHRVGLVRLRLETDAVDRVGLLCEALEARAREAAVALESNAALARAFDESRATREEAVKALEETREDMARRFLALMNTKKAELVRMRDALESAEAELEDARARLERARRSSAEHPSANGDASGRVLEGEHDVDDDENAVDFGDDEAYNTTDDDMDPTQEGGRVSARKRFGKSQSQPSQPRSSQGRKRASAKPTPEDDAKQNPKPRKQSKSKTFLADTLALLDED